MSLFWRAIGKFALARAQVEGSPTLSHFTQLSWESKGHPLPGHTAHTQTHFSLPLFLSPFLRSTPSPTNALLSLPLRCRCFCAWHLRNSGITPLSLSGNGQHSTLAVTLRPPASYIIYSLKLKHLFPTPSHLETLPSFFPPLNLLYQNLLNTCSRQQPYRHLPAGTSARPQSRATPYFCSHPPRNAIDLPDLCHEFTILHLCAFPTSKEKHTRWCCLTRLLQFTAQTQ